MKQLILTLPILLLLIGCSQSSGEIYDQKEVQDMFQMRAGWRDLPPVLLQVFSEKFESLQQAKEFAILCEDNGILTDNIKNVAKFARGNERSEAEWVVNIMLTNTLVSFSNRMGQLHEVGKMREGLGYVLRLNPNYIPAWHSMAALNFGVNNCREAVRWASKALNWKPSSSPDRFEKIVVQSMNSDAWKQMQDTMKMILKECSK